MLQHLLLFWLIPFLVGNVSVKIDTTWEQTSILGEISEFVAEKAPNEFWDYLENVEEGGNTRENYENGLKEAAKLIDSGLLPILKLSISTRKYSPRIQLHYKLGESRLCSVYFKYGRQKDCNLENIIIGEKNAEVLYNSDHKFTQNNNNTMIVYGIIGTKELRESIQKMKELVKMGTLSSFVFRNHFTSCSNTNVSLSGYGVELVMKATEYKVINENEEVDPKDLHGVNIEKLKTIHTDLREKLNDLRDYLFKIDDFTKPLKKWELKSLSIQATKMIMESNDPLKTLKKMTQDFPSHSRYLSKVNIDNWKLKRNGYIDEGINELRINGKIIENDVNIFDLIEILENEKQLVDKLFDIGIKDPMKYLTTINYKLDIPKAVFDYRNANPKFLNNVERQYGYSTIKAIIQKVDFGEVLPIAKNVFTLIFVVDPLDRNQDYLLEFARKYNKKQKFVRIGIISEKSKEFVSRIGLYRTPRILLNGELIDDFENVKELENNIYHMIYKQSMYLQNMVYHGDVDDTIKIEDFWLDESFKVQSRVHFSVINASKSKNVLKIPSNSSSLKNVEYSIETQTPIIIWIVGDFKNQRLVSFSKNVLDLYGQKYQIALISNSDCPEISKLNCDKNLNKIIGIKSGETAIVINSIIFGPLKSEELFNKKDFSMIFSSFVKTELKIENLLEFYSIFHGNVKEKRETHKTPKDIIIKENDKTIPKLSITWVLNPTTPEAQYIVNLVELIKNTMNSEIRLVFNPVSKLSNLPINRFYRYVISNELRFDENGEILTNNAVFESLPNKQLMTLGIITHDSWMIELKTTNYDLDNIFIDSKTPNIIAKYTLENVLIEGNCLDNYSNPSKGTQIMVENIINQRRFDTVVMQNLGYFQLKASPGIWKINLLDGGKISKIDGKSEFEHEIVIDSLTGKNLRLEVDKTKNDENPSILRRISNYFTDSLSKNIDFGDEINVFSLASGHLYERFLKIMMLSVVKNTSSRKVNFWILKNYASPSFKETIPELAKKYGFNVHFVEYKWPNWLRRQTEKQRIMWGYKILFLDVLFPLNVEKIIFVDADQVVRADLKELMDFDLEGAPYGYVPFCDSRREMDGFRFWKSGYWANVLGDRKYHISALYVVDLKKFREMSAGDQLRGNYHMLSRDPNSLSNLDQDLPNSMIHEVPIKSLPQEWLWCETWCDDESKNNAKTIDLCNNPMTKEPKLNSAVRIINEWKDLDEETREFSRKPSKIDL
ncbi:unnamed protein product [Caenorhabditis angaria]|uniref:UDP-glucose:glycoprotein glucosyltransferase n=1 Tax=Caenorhabditis angaria TaxID=860376 RepID=A0A9P1I2U8_9PELO|nr:unnamed protein product [Caenorhabditis angaria]